MSPIAGLTGFLIAAALAGVLFWPGRGLFWRWQELRRLGDRAMVEDALRHLHHSESLGVPGTLESLAGLLRVSRNRAADLIVQLEGKGLVTSKAGRFELTPEGRTGALRLVRAHRLLEKYLAERTGVAEADWHQEADRIEHTISSEEVEALAAAMGHPLYDPHGAPIPTPGGVMPQEHGLSLGDLAEGEAAVIAHVEDEPPAVFAQLLAQGLRVGTPVRVLGRTPQQVRIEAHGEEHVLAPVVAAQVWVQRVAAPHADESPPRRLSELAPGQQARVSRLAPACRGLQRRRLLDLGLVPGTLVEAELRSPGGDPTAYRVRGALIALRRSQADLIHIDKA